MFVLFVEGILLYIEPLQVNSWWCYWLETPKNQLVFIVDKRHFGSCNVGLMLGSNTCLDSTIIYHPNNWDTIITTTTCGVGISTLNIFDINWNYHFETCKIRANAWLGGSKVLFESP